MNRILRPSNEIVRPLIPMTVAIMAGAVLGVWLPGHVIPMTALALPVFAALIVQCIGSRRTLVLPLIFCALVGYLSIQPWLSPRLPPNHVTRFVDMGVWGIHGNIVDQPHEKQGRWRWVMAVTRLTRSGQSVEVCGRVTVTARGRFGSLGRGDGVSFKGRLRNIRNFANPGGFDYRQFMAYRRILVRTYVRARSLAIEPSGGTGHWLTAVDSLRTALGRQMDTSLSNHTPETVILLKALLLGERRDIGTRLRDRFNRAGVGHVLAISGLHIGMVATMTFFLAQWGLAMVPLACRWAWTRKGAALLSLAAVASYGVLAGLSPSTQRAMIMVAVFLARYWSGRRHDWLNALALAALIILIVDPPSLLSISFQLSFAAVLALILGVDILGPPSPQAMPGVLQRLKTRLAAFLWVSLVAILGTLPLVARYFNQTSTMGLLTNVIVVPVVGTLVVPAGLLGIAMAGLSSTAAAFCWQVAAWPMEGVCRVVEWVARWPWSAVKVVTPSTIEILLYYLTAGVLVFRRHVTRVGLVMALVLVLWGLDAGYWCYQRFGRQDLRVTALDVGQGSANLLQLPGGYTVLVDGGGFSDNRYFDVGARIIAPVLWRNKIKTIDLVVLTHPNSDHLNGLLYILDHFNVRTVWYNGETAKTVGFKTWQRHATAGRILFPRFESLPVRTSIHGVSFEILGPPADFLTSRAWQKWRDANNNSLVLRLGYKGVSMLLCADITAQAEADLLARHGPSALRSTILLAPHHGSLHSSSAPFLHAVQPVETIISCGWNNRFGFPHPKVLQRLEAVGSRVWNTAEQGAVEVCIGTGRYRIATMR